MNITEIKIITIIIIAVTVFALIWISVIPGAGGVWQHDSGVYDQQGYNIFGGWPPVYPFLLHLIGRKIVTPQIIFAIISWCFAGYMLAGLPGMILAGVFVVSPRFAGWHSMCLTESVSLSLAATTLGLSVMMIRWKNWWIPWAVSLVLFSLTRYSNVFIIPFFAWPLFFCKCKLKVIVTIIITILLTSLFISNFRKNIKPISEPGKFTEEVSLMETHLQAATYLLDPAKRPYFLGALCKTDTYPCSLSESSQWLGWLELPGQGYLWLIMLLFPISDIVRRRKLSIGSTVIIVLCLASYTQCLVNAAYDSIATGHTEVYRHLSICDCFFVFSLIALIRRNKWNI